MKKLLLIVVLLLVGLSFLLYPQTSCQITPSQAIVKVKSLPEAQAYLREKDTYISGGMVEGQDPNIYMIQIGKHLTDHNSVSDWYQVNKCSGEVKKMD